MPMSDDLFFKRTKIIATLGPSCATDDVIYKMILEGVDLFRLNASHNSDPKLMETLVNMVRQQSEKAGKYVGIFMDLQGPKIRLGKFQDGKATLKENELFELTNESVNGTEKKSSITYTNLVKDITIGDPIYIDDGKVRLIAHKKTKNTVVCKVIRGGTISNHKGVNLPDTALSVSPFTKKDEEDAITAVKCKVDYIALSFVSTKKDVQDFKSFLLKNNASQIRVISKVERQCAIDNLISIIEESDAIMVARGDLGVEIGHEKVPQTQKRIIRECNRRIKPVIVATQMLESMITSEVATRAEVSDIANAIYDHCDAVMLSGETAIGINPVNVITTMADICRATDKHMIAIRKEDKVVYHFNLEHRTIATSCCKAADQVAVENNATAIIAFTSSGNTPLIAAKINSIFPIIAPTDDPILCQRMTLYRGVIPMMMPKPFEDIVQWTTMINLAVREAVRLKLLQKNNRAVVTAGIPIGRSNGINSIRIIAV